MTILFAGSTAFLAYQNMQLQKQILALPAAPTALTSPKPTAESLKLTDTTQTIQIPGWKFYTSPSFTFQYPGEWVLETNKRISDPNTATKIDIFETNDPMMNECMQLTETKTQGNLMIKSYSGVTNQEMCSDPANPDKRQTWVTKADGDGFQPGIIISYSSKYTKPIDQIIATFKFLPTTVIETPAATPAKANLVSTDGWLNVAATTYTLQYPREYTPFSSDDLINLRHTQNPESDSVVSINRVGDAQTAKPNTLYTGGSIRDWWVRSNYDSDHPQPANLRFVETTMGAVNGLKVYEGNAFQAILVANSNNLYFVDADTTIINMPILETIVSTIRFK